MDHPLPDGNKRAAWLALSLFLDLNGARFFPDLPEVDDAESAMLRIAAREVDEEWVVRWLNERVQFPEAPVSSR